MLQVEDNLDSVPVNLVFFEKTAGNVVKLVGYGMEYCTCTRNAILYFAPKHGGNI